MATINDAVRLMYLNQTGREADPGGLEYFANRFGTSIEPDELAIFRQMAAAEVAGQEARQAAAAQQTAQQQQPPDRAAQQQAEDLARYMAEMQQVREGERGREAARVLAAQQAAAATTTTGTGIPGAPVTSSGTIRTGTTTAGATGMNITQAYQQVLGRTPSQQEIDYWTTQFGPDVDATELSTFSVAAQRELAAAPTTNNAIRQMYLSVLGREPDAAGLKYFSDRFGADVDASELGIFRGMSTQELAANAARDAGTTTSLTGTGTPGATTSLTGTTTGTVQPITRPPPVRQVTGSQLAPASFAQTAITGTPFTNLYTPSNVQQNAPRLSDIQAAAQSANPYQSLMSLTPQRTLSPAYAAQAGQTTANTNLGGYDSSLYSQPLTGLLAPSTVAGGGGTDLVNNSGDQRGPGTGNTAATGNTGFFSGLLGRTEQTASPVESRTENTAQQNFRAGEIARTGGFTSGTLGGGRISDFDNAYASMLSDARMNDAAMRAADAARYGSQITATAANVQAAQNAAAAAAIAGANTAGYDGSMGKFGGGSDSFGEGQYAKGGKVNMAPQMHNPPGPDDGYAALDNGEYVIRKSAVKKYGSNIFEQINAGKIPAQRLKSLLE